MAEKIRTPLLLALLGALVVSVTAQAGEPGFLDKVSNAAGEVWDSTKEHAGKAADWTAEKAERGFEATKEGASDAADWTADKTRKGWDKTKDGAGVAWDKTKQATGDALEWTGEKAQDAGDALKGDQLEDSNQTADPASELTL